MPTKERKKPQTPFFLFFFFFELKNKYFSLSFISEQMPLGVDGIRNARSIRIVHNINKQFLFLSIHLRTFTRRPYQRMKGKKRERERCLFIFVNSTSGGETQPLGCFDFSAIFIGFFPSFFGALFLVDGRYVSNVSLSILFSPSRL